MTNSVWSNEWIDEELIDHEVAMCEGVPPSKKYSTDWNVAGEIIVREKIGFYPNGIGKGGGVQRWLARKAIPKHLRVSKKVEYYMASGRTPLIAVMRVYIFSKGKANETNET
jgi:hypothetical protein